MAQKKIYTDEQLMDAVIRYSESFPGKIMISQLVKWTSENMPEMEGIQPHHFRRKNKRTDKAGRTVLVNNEAFERINQINTMRSATKAVKSNLLMQSADPDAFFRLPKSLQRKEILEMRGSVEQIISDNTLLSERNKILTAENRELACQNAELGKSLEKIRDAQRAIDRKLSTIIKAVDEEKRVEVLREMGVLGIEDGGFDLERYVNSLHEEITDAFSIKDAVKAFKKLSSKGSEKEDLLGKITEGIDF